MLEVVWPLSIRRKLEGFNLPGRVAAHLVDAATRSIRDNHACCSDCATIQFSGPDDDGKQVLCFASVFYTYTDAKAVVVDVEATVVEQE